ncbi:MULTISPECIES: hypothetical protein [unclassified Butyrivibrio]|uniref:hypothetical protein n=1 Tax=unclassified Butyrivibrio TaxID=2639466 RepID=UPI00041355D4|nr:MULTISPECIES: hypothetical protein [unclassified Butyrivibrio]
MSRLSEVTGLQQQRSLKFDQIVKKGNEAEITKATMENIVMSLNDISHTLAMIADGQSSNQSDTFDSIARSLAMMANSK